MNLPTGSTVIPDESSSRLSMTVLMTPDMANFSGNVHGGALLKLLDQVAWACACRHAGAYTVTLSVDQVTFSQAIHVGDLVTFHAAVNYTGRTSMEVGVKVTAENIRNRTCRHTNTCYFTMVAVDDEHNPVEVPPIEPKTRDEKRWYRGAQLRRDLRKEIAQRRKELVATVLKEEAEEPAYPKLEG